MFVVSMKANKGALVAVAAIGVALAMLLTQCNETASTATSGTPAEQTVAETGETESPFQEQGETDGTTG